LNTDTGDTATRTDPPGRPPGCGYPLHL